MRLRAPLRVYWKTCQTNECATDSGQWGIDGSVRANMLSASTTPKTVQSTTKCGRKHCEMVLNIGKGNLCQYCTVKLRPPSSFVDASSALHQDDKRAAPIATGSMVSESSNNTYDELSSLAVSKKEDS